MKEQNPLEIQLKTLDVTSLDVPCQILNQIETAINLCDCGIHSNTPLTKEKAESLLWNIRVNLESALYKYNEGIMRLF